MNRYGSDCHILPRRSNRFAIAAPAVQAHQAPEGGFGHSGPQGLHTCAFQILAGYTAGTIRIYIYISFQVDDPISTLECNLFEKSMLAKKKKHTHIPKFTP